MFQVLVTIWSLIQQILDVDEPVFLRDIKYQDALMIAQLHSRQSSKDFYWFYIYWIFGHFQEIDFLVHRNIKEVFVKLRNWNNYNKRIS